MKRFTKLSAALIALLTVLLLALPCFAEEGDAAVPTEAPETAEAAEYVAGAPFVQDWAYLIDDPARGEAMAKAAYERTGCAFCFGSVEHNEEEKLYDYARRWYPVNFPYENGLMLFYNKETATYVIYRVGSFDGWMTQEKLDTLADAFNSGTSIETGFEAFVLKAYELYTGETLTWDIPEAIGTLVQEGRNLEAVPGATPDPITGFIPVQRKNPLVKDESGVLNGSVEALTELAEKLSDTYGIEMSILAIPTLNGQDVERYADDAYDYLGYGMGDDDSGFLLLIVTEDRDYAMTGYGEAKHAFTDYGMTFLESALVEKLRNNDWTGGCFAYLNEAERLLREWQNGSPVSDPVPSPTMRPVPAAPTPTPRPSFVYQPRTLAPIWYLVAIGGGLLLALAPMKGLKKQVVENVSGREDASGYEKGFAITGGGDELVNTYTNRTEKPRYTSSGGGGGSSRSGGSSYSAPSRSTSTHISSSGRSHSGTHGKF